jgi:hypothetical protein
MKYKVIAEELQGTVDKLITYLNSYENGTPRQCTGCEEFVHTSYRCVHCGKDNSE